MQARMIREGEIVVVHLSGRVDVETAEPFRDVCLKRLIGCPVVFDFQALSFVGSSGIIPFLETMQQFHFKNVKGIKFSGVGSEFQKVFSATPLNVVEIHASASLAVEAFRNPRVVPLEKVPLNSDPGETSADHGLLSLSRPEPEDVPTSNDDDVDAS